MLSKVMGMEKKVWQTYLYDFYGELLTERQKSVYEDFVLNDYSLGEIAEERGISRQGVHDLVKRCDKRLLEYEGRLHLLERFLSIKGKIEEIRGLAQGSGEEGDPEGEKEARSRILRLSDEILEEL